MAMMILPLPVPPRFCHGPAPRLKPGNNLSQHGGRWPDFQPQPATNLPSLTGTVLSKGADTEGERPMAKMLEFLRRLRLKRSPAAPAEPETAFDRRLRKMGNAHQASRARAGLFRTQPERMEA
ncbi:hypothetical protein ACJMQP_27710 [Rhodopseudomonas palustris]